MAIADDVARQTSAATNAIRNSFAIRIEDASLHAPAHARAAILRSLSEARDSALAAIENNATIELHGRQQAAISTQGGERAKSQPPDLHGIETRNTGHRAATRPVASDSRVTGGTFRRAARAMTKREDRTTLRIRRRGSGETGKAFRPAARMTRRQKAAPVNREHTAAVFLADTLDWLNLWETAAAADDGLSADIDTNSNLLSPQLRL